MALKSRDTFLKRRETLAVARRIVSQVFVGYQPHRVPEVYLTHWTEGIASALTIDKHIHPHGTMVAPRHMSLCPRRNTLACADDIIPQTIRFYASQDFLVTKQLIVLVGTSLGVKQRVSRQ